MKGMLLSGMLVFVFGLWLAVKVGQQSGGLGILTFFFPPVGLLYALKESSVRVPAILWIIAAAWYWHGTQNVAKEVFSGMDQATIDAIARGEELTPGQQAQLHANVGGMMGVDAEPWPSDSEENDQTIINSIRLQLKQIERKRGTIMLSEAKANIEIPAHFRFLEGADVRAALGAQADGLTPGFLGWIVHESVDLSDPVQRQWAIDVIALSDGHIQAKGLESSQQVELARSAAGTAQNIMKLGVQEGYHVGFSGFRASPTLDLARHSASWVSELEYPGGEHSLRCQAIRLGRKTQVLFRIPRLTESADELCLREVRLLANSTRFVTGQDYPQANILDGKSSFTLVDLVTDKDLERRATQH